MMKRFLGITCFIYSFLIIYVWFSGNLNNYIAPNMQYYIKGSIIPLIIMGLVLVTNRKINYKFKISDLLLLIPVILVFFAGDGNLSISIAKVKATSKTIKNEEEILYDVEYEVVGDNNEEDNIVDFYFDIEDSIYYSLADYLTYMKGARKYVGKTIKVRGFAVDYSDYLTDDYFALGKYTITCCAADAEFTGFMIKYPNSKIQYGNWYEVEGRLELGKDKDGYTVMTINPVSVKEISNKDEKQYVYSCDTYGNDACKKLLEYDLEY